VAVQVKIFEYFFPFCCENKKESEISIDPKKQLGAVANSLSPRASCECLQKIDGNDSLGFRQRSAKTLSLRV
jgi:hypothetical protein